MHPLHIMAFHTLSIVLSAHSVVAKPFPEHTLILSPADAQVRPRPDAGRRALVYGLPPGWIGVFQTVTSIQPPLMNPVFVNFFSMAAKVAAADPITGRPIQRIPYGALVLEFIASDVQNQVVTKYFVEAASLWLLDAAQKGWTGFFNAWVVDQADGAVVFVRLKTVWDELVPLIA